MLFCTCFAELRKTIIFFILLLLPKEKMFCEFRKFIFNSQNYFSVEELVFTENDHCRFVLGNPNTKERKIYFAIMRLGKFC